MNRMTVLRCLALLVAAVGAPRCANATILFYDIFYNTYFEQNSASPSTGPLYYAFATGVLAELPTELSAARTTLPGSVSFLNLPQVSPGYYVYFSPYYSTQAQLLSGWPAGTYTVSVSGGTVGSLSGTVTRSAALPFPSARPSFTPLTWNAMQNYDSTGAYPFTFNTFTAPAPANLAVTFLTIFDDLTGAVAFNQFVPGSEGAMLVPDHILEPDHAYHAYLFFSSRVETANGGLGGATSIFGTDYITSAPLHTRQVCIADTDDGSGTGTRDGGVGIEDLLYYLTLYNAGVTEADVDDGSGTGTPDGGVGIEDLLYYLVRYNAGC